MIGDYFMREHRIKQADDISIEIEAVMQCSLQITSLHHLVGTHLVLPFEHDT